MRHEPQHECGFVGAAEKIRSIDVSGRVRLGHGLV
jgi:hypothetical protein